MADAVLRSSFFSCHFNLLQMVHLHETFNFFGGGGRKWNKLYRVTVSGRSALAVGLFVHLQLPALYTHIQLCLPVICPRARGSPVKLHLDSCPSWAERAPSTYSTPSDHSQNCYLCAYQATKISSEDKTRRTGYKLHLCCMQGTVCDLWPVA